MCSAPEKRWSAGRKNCDGCVTKDALELSLNDNGFMMDNAVRRIPSDKLGTYSVSKKEVHPGGLFEMAFGL